MKLRVDIDGAEYALDLRPSNGNVEYSLTGVSEASGAASVSAAGPGTYSVLLGNRSFTVHMVRGAGFLDLWAGGRCYRISITDARDRSAKPSVSTAGPLEIRSQMPGKIIKLLVQPGDRVEIGQGLVVIEAMKMQNEIKSPKEGVVAKISAPEGATVAAGESLIVVA